MASWQPDGERAVRTRQNFFDELLRRLRIPDAEVEELANLRDPLWRNVIFAVHYPSAFSASLPRGIRPLALRA